MIGVVDMSERIGKHHYCTRCKFMLYPTPLCRCTTTPRHMTRTLEYPEFKAIAERTREADANAAAIAVIAARYAELDRKEEAAYPTKAVS